MISVDEYKNDLRPDQSVTPFPDSISSLAWSPIGNRIFATTSWGGELRAYEIFQTDITQRIAYKFALPALKCCWNDAGSQLFVGLMDGSVQCYDIPSGQVAEIGKQGSAISSLHFLSGLNAVVSSGYESTVQVWRLGTPGPALSFNAENKVLATDVVFPTLVACTANERILIGDISNPTHRTVVESSDLGKSSQIQSVALNGKGLTLGVGSFDGRANISTITRNVHQNFVTKSAITFKSNKQEENGMTILYPINSVSFNPITERWFMTAGSDGAMHFWDFEAKNKIKSLNYNGIPICVARVNGSGDMIAYALGNDWHVGAEGSKWETKLGVHIITQAEKKLQK